MKLRHAERMRHCHAQEQDYLWDGQRWRRDEKQAAHRLAMECARSIERELEYLEIPTQSPEESQEAYEKRVDKIRLKAIKWASSSEGNARLDAAIKIARRLPPIPVTADQFDRIEYLWNATNGTIDLRTGAREPYNREHYITKMSAAPYDPNARAPRWERFLWLIMSGPEGARTPEQVEEMVSYLQSCVGLSMLGTQESILLIPWGSGANGKSTFFISLHELFADYALKSPAKLFLKRERGDVPNDVARLAGARLVYASETAEGARLSAETIKDITGGEDITARYMHGDFFTFKPSHTLWLATNNKPIIADMTEGIWRRVKLIPFLTDMRTLPEAERLSREAALAEFRAEQAGILAWCVRGAIRVWNEGMREPAQVTKATSEYRQQMDAFGEFISGSLVEMDEKEEAEAEWPEMLDAVYTAYRNWCEESGEHLKPKKVLARQLRERGIETKHTRKGTGILHWRLTTEDDRIRKENTLHQRPQGRSGGESNPEHERKQGEGLQIPGVPVNGKVRDGLQTSLYKEF